MLEIILSVLVIAAVVVARAWPRPQPVRVRRQPPDDELQARLAAQRARERAERW